MSDDLTARCTAEVRAAMEQTPHLDVTGDSYCTCKRERRLAATLGRMMAAFGEAVRDKMLSEYNDALRSGCDSNGAYDCMAELNVGDVALRAITRERGGMDGAR